MTELRATDPTWPFPARGKMSGPSENGSRRRKRGVVERGRRNRQHRQSMKLIEKGSLKNPIKTTELLLTSSLISKTLVGEKAQMS